MDRINSKETLDEKRDEVQAAPDETDAISEWLKGADPEAVQLLKRDIALDSLKNPPTEWLQERIDKFGEASTDYEQAAMEAELEFDAEFQDTEQGRPAPDDWEYAALEEERKWFESGIEEHGFDEDEELER